MKIGGRVQELCLDTYFGLKWPKVVSRPQTRKSRNVFRYHGFSEFIL